MSKERASVGRSVSYWALAGFGLLVAALIACGNRDRTEMTAQQMREHFRRGLEKILDRLDATDEQRKQIRTVVARLEPRHEKLHQARKQAMATLTNEWGKKQMDPQVVDKATGKMLDELVAARADLTTALVEIHGILTPEQRAQVAEHMAKHRKRRRWGCHGH